MQYDPRSQPLTTASRPFTCRFTVEMRDALKRSGWGPQDMRPCTVLMMEVLDNCAHDKVCPAPVLPPCLIPAWLDTSVPHPGWNPSVYDCRRKRQHALHTKPCMLLAVGMRARPVSIFIVTQASEAGLQTAGNIILAQQADPASACALPWPV